MTTQTLAVLRQFLDQPSTRRYGLDLAKGAGLKSGTIYPILARLERDGLLTSAWERIDPSVEGRRPRRYYVLTGVGERVAREEIAAVRRLLGGVPRPAGEAR